MATGTSLTDTSENLLLNFLLNNQTATRPTAWYVSLHTADPTEAGTGTEVSTSGTAYVRQAIVFGAASGGTTSNTALITFPTATASWGTVTHCGIWSASSAGTCYLYGPLSASAAVTTGITYSFPIASVAASLD